MNPMQIMQMLSQFKGNPAQMLSQRGMQVPPAMMSNPEQMVRHLMQTGQVNQNALNQAMQIASQMGIKL